MSLVRIAHAEVASIVEEVARALVDRPDQVLVHILPQENAPTVVQLFVAPDDRGKVIGKRGRTAHSLRILLSAVGSHRGFRYSLDIVEVENTGTAAYAPANR